MSMLRSIASLKRRRRFAPFYALLALAGSLRALPQESNKKAAEEGVREAVYRYQIQTWELAAHQYCLSINGKNPSKKFLGRFRPLPVVAGSRCKRKKTLAGYEVVDKASGKPSVVFETEKLTWISDFEVEIMGAYDCADLCWASGIYHVTLEDGRWVIKSFKIRIQS
jgi:hypothetical protein